MAFCTLLFVYFICLIRFKFPEDRKNTSFVLIIPWSFVYSSSQEIQKKCVHSTFFLNIKADPGISLVVQRLRLWAPNVGGLASIPGQETRCHIPQWKIPHAATKTRHSRIKKKKKADPGEGSTHCISVILCEVKWESLSRVRLFETSWTIRSMEFLWARILEWVAFPFSRGSSQQRDWTQVSRTADRFFTSWATREVLLCVCGMKSILSLHFFSLTLGKISCRQWSMFK